jgi:predicted nucleic acid-binding protein
VSVVSDASALINLARIGELDLLRQLYGELWIPEAVWREVVIEGAGQPGAEEVKAVSWIETHDVANEHLVRALRQDLDAGEAEAIARALEVGADLLLMDERLGRETARYLGVRYVGLVGVLIAAKRSGLTDAVKSRLDALREMAGFRVSDTLYTRVLRDEGEM